MSAQAQQYDAEEVIYFEESTNDSLYLPGEVEEKVVEEKLFAKQNTEIIRSKRYQWRNVTLGLILLAGVITFTLIYLRIKDDEQQDSVKSVSRLYVEERLFRGE